VDREGIERLIRERLVDEPSVVAAWLFGSVARGTATPRSDVDVAILSRSVRSTVELLDLQVNLTSTVGAEVQIVELETAPTDLVHRVLRDGRLLVDRDKTERIRFEVDARNRYFDMKPILLEYRRQRGAA